MKNVDKADIMKLIEESVEITETGKDPIRRTRTKLLVSRLKVDNVSEDDKKVVIKMSLSNPTPSDIKKTYRLMRRITPYIVTRLDLRKKVVFNVE